MTASTQTTVRRVRRAPNSPAPKTTADYSSQPIHARVGLPHVPAMYGLKHRKEYLPWKHVTDRMKHSRNYWICSTRPDGRPHSIPVWGHWEGNVLYFGTARQSRKGQNLARNPFVSVHLESGDDVVILEGEVAEVSQQDVLGRIDQGVRKKYKMPLLVIPGQTVVYEVRPRVVLAWSEKNFPNDATRWEFEEPKSG